MLPPLLSRRIAPPPPACVQELQAVVQEREEQLGQRDAEVAQLQQHCGRLLGIPAEEVPSLAAAAVPLGPAGLTQRMAELEVRARPLMVGCLLGLSLSLGTYVLSHSPDQHPFSCLQEIAAG